MAEQRRKEVIVTEKESTSFDDNDVNLAGNSNDDITGFKFKGRFNYVGDIRRSSQSSFFGSFSGSRETGRDANRLNYFNVPPFDVNYGADDLTGINIATNGGGSRPRHSIRTLESVGRQITVSSFVTNGGEVVVQEPNQELVSEYDNSSDESSRRGGGEVVEKDNSGIDVNDNVNLIEDEDASPGAGENIDQEFIKQLKKRYDMETCFHDDGTEDYSYLDVVDITSLGRFGGRKDENRLDYFCVPPFDVFGDDDLGGISSDGGGGDIAIQASRGISYDDSSGRDINVRRNQHLVQRMEQGSASAAPRSFPVRSVATNVGFDGIGSTLNQEMLSEYGASDAPTQEVPFGIVANNSNYGGGELVAKRLEDVRQCADATQQSENLSAEVFQLIKAAKVTDGMRIVEVAEWDQTMEEMERLRAEVISLKEQNQELNHKVGWALGAGLKGFVKKLRESVEFNVAYGRVSSCATSSGYADGVRKGYRYSKTNTPINMVPMFDPQAEHNLDEAIAALNDLTFPYLDAIEANSHLSIEEIEAIEPAVPKKT